jgi:diguanylate cyclase (GGDEF)-like protein
MRRGRAQGMRPPGLGPGPGTAPPPARPVVEELPPVPEGMRPPPPGNLHRAPFRFLLIDNDGRVMLRSGDYQTGDRVRDEDRARAVPVEVDGRVVAWASPQGEITYSDLDKGYVAAIREALLYGAIAATALALILGLLFGTGLSRALKKLTAALQGMERGVLRQRVAVTSRDEVGVLASAFNRMSEELAQSHAALEESNAQIRQQAQQLHELSIRDPLTQLHNRRYFDEHSASLFDLAQRHDQTFAVMIGDIDYFKRVNDTYSHAMGDAVLRQVAELLQANVRHTDLLARYGGEEFVIAFPQTSLEQAVKLCEKLRSVIEAWPWFDLQPDLRVTMSMGISANLSRGSVEGMLREADDQLYRAKAAGRNRVCVPA